MSESKNLLEKIPSPEVNGYQSDQFPIGMQVLAIDANIVCLTYLVTLLRKCHYQVTATTKAAEALEILRTKEKFDIVLTNVVRLDIDGFKLLEIISHEMGLPVVLVSTNDDQANIMRGIRNGAKDFLLKPVRLLEIMNIWQHVVRKNLSDNSQRSLNRNVEGKAAESPVNLDGEEETTKMRDEEAGDSESILNPSKTTWKKSRLNWSPELHSMFQKAVQQLGGDAEAKPNEILKIMNVPGVTRENVASHLQKYRITLKKHNGTTSEKANNILEVCSTRTTSTPSTASSGESDLHKAQNSLSLPSQYKQLVTSKFPSKVHYPNSFIVPNKQMSHLQEISMTPPNMIMPNPFPMQELEFPSTFHPGANLKNVTPPGIVAPKFSSSNNGIQDDDQVGTNNYKACFSYPSPVMLRDDSTAGRPRNSFSQHASQMPDFSNPSQMQGPVTMDSGRVDITEVGTQLLVDQFLMVPSDDLQG